MTTRRSREKPVCEQLRPWLEHHLGKHCLAPLTGQDRAALNTFVHAVQIHAFADDDGQRAAIRAMAAAVDAMQPSVRFIAKRSIPMVLDWSDEERLWAKVEALRSGPSLHVLEGGRS